MDAYFSQPRTAYKLNGSVDFTEVRYVPYDKTQSCALARANFSSLSPSAKLAGSSLTIPTPPDGEVWVLRDCNGGSGPGDIYATVDSDGFVSDGGGGGTTPDYNTKGIFGGVFSA